MLVCLFVWMFVYLFVCLFVCLSVCLFVCLSVLGKFSNFFQQYKAAAVRAVISIRYGSKEGVEGSLLVHQYILP